MKKIAYLFLLCTFLLTLACGRAGTRLTAVTDPTAKKTFKKIMVFAMFSDLTTRKDTEQAFISKLQDEGVAAISSMEVLPPTREYSEQEYEGRIKESGADAVLLVSLTDREVKRIYVPRSSTTTGQATANNTGIQYSERTQHSGGYYINKPLVYYRLELLDVHAERVAWVASSRTGGNAFASYGTLIKSLSGKTVEQLAKDGMVVKK